MRRRDDSGSLPAHRSVLAGTALPSPLGAGSYTYAAVTLDEQMQLWLRAHVPGFEFCIHGFN